MTSSNKPASAGEGTHIVKSVARTLEILEYFDEVRQPVNVITVSLALGYPQSSTSALLRSMVAMGYLKFDRVERTYLPTDRVPLLGCWLNPTLFAEASLPRLLQAITERSGQLVLLGARNGDHAQYIQVLDVNHAVDHHIRLGTKRPLATSGVGKALLSAHDDKEVRRIFHRINAYREEGVEAIKIPELLLSLADVRRKGYFVSIDQVVNGSGLIAMLLPTECTDRPLALGIGAPTATILARESELVQIMREEMKRFFGQFMNETNVPKAANRNAFGGQKIQAPTQTVVKRPYTSIMQTV
ncbi:IclR family transcriptional regulator [Oryzicola mucosus]|uniref:Helix-turn-helix domain-containing protein n=1 Tax=Oryzicola mucosus TaxID=2767425 RepID=A0A8J6PYQ1_9HYPH|nr:helix-turn-helix domain-containing protein [Oryzicola mucosus]MBD0416732.1 helix-turn-helix domain-containing protein [Oryzicola mucosus]